MVPARKITLGDSSHLYKYTSSQVLIMRTFKSQVSNVVLFKTHSVILADKSVEKFGYSEICFYLLLHSLNMSVYSFLTMLAGS